MSASAFPESLQIHRGKYMTLPIQQHLSWTPFCDPRTKLRGKTQTAHTDQRAVVLGNYARDQDTRDLWRNLHRYKDMPALQSVNQQQGS